MDGNIIDSNRVCPKYDYYPSMIINKEGDIVICGTRQLPNQTFTTPFVLKVRGSDLQVDTMSNISQNYDTLCATTITSGILVYDTAAVNIGLPPLIKNINELVVYPNPAQDFINVISPSFTNAITKYEILDITGRIIKLIPRTQPNNCIFVGDLSNGLYFLKIIYGQQNIHSLSYRFLICK
jgi:hypothetical protein